MAVHRGVVSITADEVLDKLAKKKTDRFNNFIKICIFN